MSGIDALGLLALRHHQVADQDADERDPVVLVAHAAGRRLVALEVDLARDFFAHFRVHDQVREEEAGEEGHVGIKDVVPGRGRRERSQGMQDDRAGRQRVLRIRRRREHGREDAELRFGRAGDIGREQVRPRSAHSESFTTGRAVSVHREVRDSDHGWHRLSASPFGRRWACVELAAAIL